MPENVNTIVEHSCFGCHNTDSKNDNAKEKLDFKTMEELGKIKKIGTYNHIVEALEKQEMPPEKFLAKYPEKKLSEEEAELLMNWAKNQASALIEQ